jgi:DeoR family fructose operon transcriptional repressor
LLQFLEERKEATIESLAAELGISSATVRRDLKELDDLGLVRRLQGGAVAVSSISKEAPFSVRETEHSREKKLIAQYAANFVKDGDVLFS